LQYIECVLFLRIDIEYVFSQAMKAAKAGGGLQCQTFPSPFRPGMTALMYPDFPGGGGGAPSNAE
jgi:hypothetical protein